jgi:hypothetical protein
MTKAILLVWLTSFYSPSAPGQVEFDSMDACLMAANELQRSVEPTRTVQGVVARCVDLGKAP